MTKRHSTPPRSSLFWKRLLMVLSAPIIVPLAILEALYEGWTEFVFDIKDSWRITVQHWRGE